MQSYVLICLLGYVPYLVYFIITVIDFDCMRKVSFAVLQKQTHCYVTS